MTAMGPSMGLVEQEEPTQAEPDDEITNLLLRWLSTYSNFDQHFILSSDMRGKKERGVRWLVLELLMIVIVTTGAMTAMMEEWD